MEEKIIQIIIPLIFAFGILWILYIFFKSPKIILKDFFKMTKDIFQEGLLYYFLIPLLPIFFLLFIIIKLFSLKKR